MLKHKDKLEKNIVDQIKEAQLKLGFVRETVRLYYPWESLRVMLKSQDKEIGELCRRLENSFPEFSFSHQGDRIEVCVPPDYVEYVHREVEAPPFLAELIRLFSANHHLTLEQIKGLFEKFGEYIYRQMPEGADFDYVFHFRNTAVDEYYYCIRMEMGHTIYHRFMKSDFEQLLL